MGMNSVEQEILNEKEKLAESIVLVASELSRINSPEIRVWDGYCPESTSDEIAHFHYDSPNGIICISRYRLRSMSFDEIEKFRENLFKKSLKKDLINLEDAKQEFLYLVDFYKSAQIDNTKLWTDELEPVLLKPLREFFMRVDNLFSTDYLRKKIVQIFIAKSEEVSFSKRIRASISKKYRQK